MKFPETIRRKFTVAACGLRGLALIWLAWPGTAAGSGHGTPEVNIKTKFAEITLPAGENRPWNELFGDEITKAFAAYPQNESLMNSAGGTGSGTGIMMVSNSASSIWTIQKATAVGVLSDPQFRVVLKALDQRDGVDVLTAPEVTTESTRQAQVRAVDIAEIINGSGAGSNRAPSAMVGRTNLALGPSLDVLPTVSADGFSVNLTLIPSLMEFVGYDNPGPFVPQAAAIGDYDAPARPGALGAAPPVTMTPGTVPVIRNPGVGVAPQTVNPGGQTIAANLPLPHFRLRQTVLDVDIWDCQTVVIGFPAVEFPAKEKDKPAVKKALLVFVTATLINPDGTRAHSDEEIASARSSIPPQTGTNSVPKK